MATALRASEVEAVFRARDEMSGVMDNIQNSAESTGFSLTRAAETALGFAAGMIGLQGTAEVFNLVKSSVFSVNNEIDVARIRFGALGMSVEGASAHVKELMTFANTTPFSTESIIAASEKLHLMGGAALDTASNLQLLVDAGAATGMGVDTLATMFGRMYSALQNGLPISRYLTTLQRSGVVTGEAVAKIKEMEKAGASSADIWAVLTGNVERFAGTGAKLASTWGALISIIKQSVSDLSATAFRPFFETVKGGMLGIADWLRSAKVEEWAVGVAAVVSRVTAVFGTIFQAVGPAVGELMRAFGAAFMSLLTAVEPLAKPLGDLMAAMFGANTADMKGTVHVIETFGDTLKSLQPAIQGAFDLLSAISNLIATVVLKAFLFLHDIMHPFIGSELPQFHDQAEKVGHVLEILAGWVDQVTAAYERFMPWLSSSVVQFLKSKPVIDGFNTAMSTARDVVQKIRFFIMDVILNFKDLHDPVQAVSAALYALGFSWDDINGFIATFKKDGAIVLDILERFGPSVLVIVGGYELWNAALLINKGLIAMGPIFAFIGGMFGLASATGRAAAAQWLLNFAMLANPIGVTVVLIVALIAALVLAYQNIGPFREAVNHLGNKLLDIGKAVLPVLIAGWEKLQPALAAAGRDFGKILPPLMRLLDLLWNGVGGHGGLKEILGAIGVIILALLAGAFGALIGFLSGVIPMAVNLVVDVITLMIDTFNLFADVVADVAAIVTDIFTGQWRKLYDDVVKLWTDLWTNVLVILGDLVIGISHLLTGLGLTIMATVMGLIFGIIDFFTWLADKLVGHSIIPDMIKAIVAWFQGLPGMIVAALGALGGWLLQKGRDLVQGFFDGMAAVWNGITTWVGGLAGWVAAHKGPLSTDQTILYKNGLAIMSGLHDGMKEGWSEIQKTVATMNATLPNIGGGGVGGGAFAGLATAQLIGPAELAARGASQTIIMEVDSYEVARTVLPKITPEVRLRTGWRGK